MLTERPGSTRGTAIITVGGTMVARVALTTCRLRIALANILVHARAAFTIAASIAASGCHYHVGSGAM